jgi:hypothetical protein
MELVKEVNNYNSNFIDNFLTLFRNHRDLHLQFGMDRKILSIWYVLKQTQDGAAWYTNLIAVMQECILCQ